MVAVVVAKWAVVAVVDAAGFGVGGNPDAAAADNGHFASAGIKRGGGSACGGA